MNSKLTPLTGPALAVLFLTASGALWASDVVKKEKFVIKTTDADVIEADVSDLVVGESRAFTTASGKTVDILRTADGMELYIDGELQDLGFGDHVAEIHHDIDVECFSDDEGECDAHVLALHAEGLADGYDHKFISKRVEVLCDEDENCEKNVWISDGEDLDFAGDLHTDAEHDVIIIKKHVN